MLLLLIRLQWLRGLRVDSRTGRLLGQLNALAVGSEPMVGSLVGR